MLCSCMAQVSQAFSVDIGMVVVTQLPVGWGLPNCCLHMDSPTLCIDFVTFACHMRYTPWACNSSDAFLGCLRSFLQKQGHAHAELAWS